MNVLLLFTFIIGAMAGYLIGLIVGWCQMDELHHKAGTSGGYTPVYHRHLNTSRPPRSIRPTPPGAE